MRVRPAALIFVAMLIAAPSARAQQASPKVVAELQAIENEWSLAIRTHNSAALERILGQEYYLFDAADNKTITRADLIESTRTDKTTYSAFTATISHVAVYGDVAVALGTLTKY